MEINFAELSNDLRDNLLNDIIPFWEKYSPDYEDGGYFSCIKRDGAVFDTDKFIWLQAREVYIFSKFYNSIEKKNNWLAIAEHGAAFLIKHGRDGEGSWYFSLTKTGQPLIQPYNIFSDCFAALAFNELFHATQFPQYKDIAYQTYHHILKRRNNPKGIYNKNVPHTRSMISLAFPMILAYLSSELKNIIEPEIIKKELRDCKDQIFNLFLNTEMQLLHEHVGPDGKKLDCFNGRLINPGHSLESMWFILDMCEDLKDDDLIDKTAGLILNILDFGWDKKYGGIFYFLDIMGKPPQQLEWDQKLWWVHLEALIAILKAYRLTGNKEFLIWYKKVHEFSWNRFPDPEFGEWFGYLNRKGEVLLSLKGCKWKGCFHVPRGLFLLMKEMDKIQD